MKKLLAVILVGLVLTGFILASCSNQPATTKVRVATDASWNPFEYVDDKSKQIMGFDIDLFDAIAKKENLTPEYVNVAFNPLLAGMAQGSYDAAISSIIITEELAKKMLFSDPYFAAGQIVVVLKSNTTFTSKDDLTGSVGTQLGTTGADQVALLKNVTPTTYNDIDQAFQDLMSGQITAVICGNPVALKYVGKNPDKFKIISTVFTDENYGIAVAKGKADLLSKINDGIKAIKSEDLIDQLSQKWNLKSR